MPTASDVREMTDAEILDAVNLAKSELFNLRFQRANGQLTNPLRIRSVRRDIARFKTILRQRQLAREIVEQEEN